MLSSLYQLPLLFGGQGGGPDGGFWFVGPLMLVLWLGLTAAVVWLVVRYARPGRASGIDRAREILAERFARGELSNEEYRQRLDQLR